MELAMVRYRLILMYLNRLIFEKTINHKIINYLSTMESYDYHIERYNTISKLYYDSFPVYYKDRIYSFVLNSEIYVSKPDQKLTFYNETQQSYQVRDLLLSLISIPVDNSINSDSLLSDEVKEWLYDDDIMYGKLARKIMEKMV